MAGKRITTKSVAESDRPFVTYEPKVDVDEDGWGKDGLTLKQRRFVKAFIGPAAGNATKAADMAGYNANNRLTLQTTASDTLRKPMVQRAIAYALAKRRNTKGRTLAGITELATTNAEDYINADGSFDLEKAREAGAMGAIRELDIEEIGPGVRRIKVKLYDRIKALALLAKIHGSLPDEPAKPSMNSIDVGKLTTDELAQLLKLCRVAEERAGRPADESLNRTN